MWLKIYWLLEMILGKDDHILINRFYFVSFNEILNSPNEDKLIGNAISRPTSKKGLNID